MKFSERVTRCALIGWALYLVVALSAFALHQHSAHEGGAAPCALCVAHNVTGAATVAATFVLVIPALVWRLQLWLCAVLCPIIAAPARVHFSRGPPVETFSLSPD